MRHSLKKYVLTGFLLVILVFGLDAQIIVLQYRSVPQENVAEFMFRESTYWAELARKNVRDGKMLKWELWQRIGGYELDADAHNFVFVNVYEDKYDLDANIWDIQSIFPNRRLQDMATTGLGRTIHQLVLEQQTSAGIGVGTYAKINYAKVSDMDAFLEFESNVWQPFIDKAIIDGNTSFVSWNLSTVVTPTGSNIPFDAVTIDHFDKYSEAVIPRWSEDLEMPDVAPSLPTRDRILAQIYGLVVSVE